MVLFFGGGGGGGEIWGKCKKNMIGYIIQSYDLIVSEMFASKLNIFKKKPKTKKEKNTGMNIF